MAEEGRTAKTETIGPIAIDKLSKLDDWKKYQAASEAFSKAKDAAKKAKDQMRVVLKAKLVAQKKITEDDKIDFTPDGTYLNVFKVFGARKEKAELDLTF